MFKDIENAELETEFINRLLSPPFLVCKSEPNTQKPLVSALSTWEEMNLDSTKCVIIRLPNGKRIYEWFRGNVRADQIREFIIAQNVGYTKSNNFTLKIIWDSKPENDRILVLDQPISSQCTGTRLNLRLIPLSS